jgi:hypothetical protein
MTLLLLALACAPEVVVDDTDRQPAMRWDGFVVETAETSCSVFRAYWAKYGETGDGIPIERYVSAPFDDDACEVCMMQLIPWTLTGDESAGWHACEVAVAAYGDDGTIDEEWPPCPGYSVENARTCLVWWEEADLNAITYWELTDACWNICDVETE